MGIDRSDEDDAPSVMRDSRTTGSDSGTPAIRGDDSRAESATDRAAEHIRYRALVETHTECEVARKAWNEGLPALQEAWVALEGECPDHERSGPTLDHDGSRHSDSDLKLEPKQNAEATRGCLEIRELAKDDILPAMHRIEMADSERSLVGLEHWLKGENRLKEKVAARLRYQPELTVGEALAGVPDAVRFTFAYSETRYAEGVRADIRRLKAEGFELIKLRNSWMSDQYKGINSQWRRPESGLRFEVQFHTEASFEAKQLTHKAYQRLRSPLTRKDEEDELVAYQRHVNALIPPVPGAADIENYPLEKRDV
jgi:hypothetical protein